MNPRRRAAEEADHLGRMDTDELCSDPVVIDPSCFGGETYRRAARRQADLKGDIDPKIESDLIPPN
jgi:hypothetical protein